MIFLLVIIIMPISAPYPILLPAWADSTITRPAMPFVASSALVGLRVLTLMLLLCTRMNSGPSSRRGVQAPVGL